MHVVASKKTVEPTVGRCCYWLTTEKVSTILDIITLHDDAFFSLDRLFSSSVVFHFGFLSTNIALKLRIKRKINISKTKTGRSSTFHKNIFVWKTTNTRELTHKKILSFFLVFFPIFIHSMCMHIWMQSDITRATIPHYYTIS